MPKDYEVVSGTVDFTVKDESTLTINASNNAIVNYKSFDIAQNEKVIVNLPDSSSQILNRVNSGLPTNIAGALTCERGLVILVNESGIYIAPTATITAEKAILSTRDISNERFIAGNYIFEKISKDMADRLLLNEGTIKITNGGFGVFIAGAVENRGLITAQAGTIAMASGDGIRLKFNGNSLISIDIDKAVAGDIVDYQGNKVLDQIKNSGTLDARGGSIILTADALSGIFRKAINLDGIAIGTKIEQKDGKITIVAEGSVSLSGKIEATTINVGTMPANILTVNDVIPAIGTPDKVTIEEIAQIKAEEAINIIAENAVQVGAALEAPSVTIVAGGSIDTPNAAIIQGTSVNLTAPRLGTSITPVNIQADNIHITKLNGDIDIRQSIGIGTSVQITGPPDGENINISYNKNASQLTLEGRNIFTSGNSAQKTVLIANSLRLIAEESIGAQDNPLYFNASVLASAIAKNGSMHLNSDNTDINIRGDVRAYGDINIYSGVGAIDILGENIVIGSTVGNVNLEATTGKITTICTVAAPEGTVRLWTATTLAISEITLYSKDGTYIWNPADETIVKWDRGAGNNNWSSANNWNPNGVPSGAGYHVIIDGTYIANPAITLNNNYTIGALEIVVGTLTYGATNNRSLTIADTDATITGPGPGGVSIGASGALVMHATNTGQTLNISGNYSNAGTFTCGIGTVVFNKATGTQTLDSGGTAVAKQFNNLTHSGAGTLQIINNDVTITSTLNASAGILDPNGRLITGSGTNTLTVASGATIQVDASAFTGNYASFETRTLATGSTVEYDGGSAQAVDTGLSYSNLTFSGAGTKTTAAGTLTVGGNWAVGSTTALNTNNTIVSLTGNLTGAGDITQGTGLITVASDWLNTGTFTASSAGVTLTGAGHQITGSSSGITFTTLTVNNTYTNNNTAGLTILTALSGSSTLTQGTNAILNISGTSGITGLTATASGSIVNYNGGSAQTVKATTYNTLKINNTAGVTLAGPATVTTLTIGDVTSNSVFNDGGYVLTSTGTLNLNNGSTYKLGSAGTATIFPAFATRNIDTGTTVEYAAGVAQTVSTTPSYSNLTFSGAGTKTAASGTLSVGGNWAVGSTTALSTNNTIVNLTGNLTGNGAITQGTGAINIGGNWTHSGTFTAGSGGVNYNGTSAQLARGMTYTTLKINNAAGVTLAGPATVTTLTIGDVTSSSIFDDGGYQVTSTGTLNLASGIFRLGSATAATTFPAFATSNISAGTTVEYKAGVAQTISAAPPYQNLIVSGNSTKTLGGSIIVNGDFSINAGTLDASTNNYNISVTGNWSDAGSFTARAGTVTFTGSGTSAISGSTTFNNLTCTIAGKQLTFQAGSTQTITGTLTLTGLTGNPLILRSSSSPTQWRIDPQGSRNVDYVDVQDSNNISAASMSPAHFTDSGNNTNWFYSVRGYVYSDQGITLIGPGVTITLVVNGSVRGSVVTTGSGQYGFNSTIASGNAVLVYINDGVVLITGNAVTVAASSTITSLDIYGGILIVKHENAGPMTNTILGTAKGVLTDPKIVYSVSGSDLTVNGTLYIATGKTFAPGGNIQINEGGFINKGTFTNGNNKITLNATANSYSIESGGAHLYNVDLLGTGSYTLADDLTIDGNLTFKGYSYYKEITIDRTKISEVLTNYPLLFAITDPNLRTVADGGYVTSVKGFDIVFYDALGNKLDHEMEQYDGPAGKVVAWIRIPTLSNAADTKIYIYYSNAEIVTSQENTNAVWGTNFLGVWHMSQTPPTPIYDSTANAHDGNTVSGGNPQQVYSNGRIGGSIAYDSIGDGTVMSDPIGTGVSTLTVGAWVKIDTIQSGSIIVEQASPSDAAPYSSFALALGQVANDANFSFAITDAATSTRTIASTISNTANTVNWIYVVGVWDGSAIKLYVNGAQSGTSQAKTGTLVDYSTNMDIAYHPFQANTYLLDGIVDEVRVSNTAKSAGWISTEYKNQLNSATLNGADPNAFMSVGSQAAVPGPTINAGNHIVTVGGNVLIARGTFNAGTSTVVLNGTAAQNVTTGPNSFYNLTVTNASAAGAYMSSGLTVTHTLTIGTNAILDLQNNNLVATGATFTNAGTLKLQGGQTITGLTVDTLSGTVEYNGEEKYTGLAAGNNYYNLTFSSAGFYTLTGNVVVSGSLKFVSAYNYYKPLIIDHTKIGQASLADFVVLISMTDPDLKYTGNGGYVTNPQGYDILFTDSDNGRLDFEIEKYDNTTGQLIAWVRVPTLTNTADTTLFLYFGNKNTVKSSKENVAGVWNTNFKGVYHMGEASGTIYDSTSYNNDGVANIGVTMDIPNAIIDGGDWYSGSSTRSPEYGRDGYVSTGLYSDEMTNVTFSTWFKADSTTIGGATDVYDEERLITQRRTGGVTGQTSRISLLLYENQVCAFYYTGSNLRIYGGAAINDHSWHMATVTYDGTNLRLYRDGVQVATATVTGLYTPSHEFVEFGRQTVDLRYFYGTLDEARMSDAARSAGWILTEYNNQSNPATFYSTGARATGNLANTIAMGTNTITIAKDLDNSGGGTFTGTGTIAFNTSAISHILGSTIFPNLSCTVPSKSLIFPANKTQTIKGTLDLNGQAAGTEIVLNSDNPGAGVSNRFTLNVYGNQTVSRVNVSNSQISSTGGTYNVTANNSIQGSNTDSGEAAPHWIFAIPSFSITGRVYTDKGVTVIGSGKNIYLVINGALWGTSVATNASSDYTFTNVSYSLNDSLLVYIGGDTNKGNTVTIAPSANITGLDIWGNSVITRYDTASGPVTNTTLGNAKGGQTNTDILYSVTGSNLTTTRDLVVWTNKNYTPGGTVSANDVVIRAGATYNAAGNNITASGSWTNSGTFTHGGNTVTFTAGAAGKTITSGGSHFNKVTFNNILGGWTLADAFYADSDFTITAGTMNAAGYAMTISGNWANAGTFNHGNNTVTLNGTGSHTISTGGTGTGKAFYNLVLNGRSTYTLQNYDADIDGNLTLTGPSWTNGYYYRKALTIDYQQVSETVTDFPMLFSVIDDDLKSTTYGGRVTNANGYDIIITDANGTKLNHEIETYDPVTGTLVTWVKVPTISSTENTSLYVYYGNSSVTTSQENKTGVWNADYLGVWHMNQIAPTDSTSGAHNGTAIGTPVAYPAGQIDGAVDFNGTTTGVSMADFLGGNVSKLTVGAWVKIDTINAAGTIIGQAGPTNADPWTSFILKLGDNAGDQNFSFGITASQLPATPARQTVSTAVGTANTTDWIYVVGVWDGYAVNNNMMMFVNGGVSGAPNNGQTGTLVDYTTTNRIASYAYSGSTYLFDGKIDEVRVSSVARSPGWIATEYNNQANPASFCACGTEDKSAITTLDTAGRALNVKGNVTNTLGTITAGSSVITVAGNWTNNGTFTPGTSTVIFAGNNGSTSTLSGATNFYNLTCTTPSKQLTFPAGVTQTVDGVLNLNGQATGTRVLLRSSTTGTRFTLDVTARDQVVSFVDVQDSNASSHDIYDYDYNNAGNNDNLEVSPHWVFPTGHIYYWTGSSTWETVNNWATMSGGTTRFASYPQTANDIVVFDGGGLSNCSISASESIRSIDIQGATGLHGAYTGIITAAAGVNLTTSQTVTVSGGTLTMGTGTLTSGGTLTVSGGTLNASNGNITASSDIAISSGTLTAPTSGKTFNVAGNWTKTGGTFTPGTGTATFNGGSASIDAGGTGTGSAFNKVIINSTGIKTVASPMMINNNLQVDAGTLEGNSDVTVKGGSVTGNGKINMTDGTFTVQGTGTFGGSTNDWTFYNLTFGDGTTTTTTTKTGTNAINVSNVLAINTNHTLQAGATDWNLSWASYLKLIKEISAGYDHTLALTEDGSVYAWGCNFMGQIGINSLDDSLMPSKVWSGEQGGGTYLHDIIHIAAGGYHNLALASDGSVYGWGWNYYGQLGNNTTTDALTPVKVWSGAQTGGSYLHNISQVSVGGASSAAVVQDGSVFTWGYNGEGELGNGTLIDSPLPVQVLTGEQAGGTYLSNVSQISVGGTQMVALLSDGSVYSWGKNAEGELGNGFLIDKSRPVRVVAGMQTGGTYLHNIIKIMSGESHTLALAQDGSVYSWGDNVNGQLGNSSLNNSPVQVLAGAQTGGTYLHNIIGISAGVGHSLAIAQDGSLYSWGDNEYGQLGVESYTNSSIPVQVHAGAQGVAGGAYLRNISLAAAGGAQTVALTQTSPVFAAGCNASGQLGNGTYVGAVAQIKVMAGEQGGPSITHTPLVISGTLQSQTSTINFADAYHKNVNIPAATYYNVNFNGNPLQTFHLTGDIVLLGGITTNTTAVSAEAHNITVAGNWTNNDGTFISTGGTVIFNGTNPQSVISGANAFNVITIKNTSTGGVSFLDRLVTATLNAKGADGVKKISFATASLIAPNVISTSFNVDGLNGSNLLELAPTTPNTTWYLDAPTSSHSYLKVGYSYQVNGKTQTATGSSNQGNNTNWNITP